MSFLRPDLWWVAVAAALVIVIARRLGRRRVLAVTTLSLLTHNGYRASRVRHLPLVLTALSLALVLAALLEPVVPFAEQQIEARGLDIVLVVDLSLSMTQPIGFKDGPGVLLPPSRPGGQRIDAIKEALRDFIVRRRDDRIGVVVFSDHAYVVSPLTFDKEPLFGYFDLIDPGTLIGEGMTAIGDGITMATFLLSRQSPPASANKVIVVFTDGANNLGEDPVEALEDSSAAGVRVHVVGVDLEQEQQRHPEVGQFIAAVRQHGGRFYAADSRGELEAASRALDRIEKGPLSRKTYVRNNPAVRWFALSALALLLTAVGLRTLPFFIGLH